MKEESSYQMKTLMLFLEDEAQTEKRIENNMWIFDLMQDSVSKKLPKSIKLSFLLLLMRPMLTQY